MKTLNFTVSYKQEICIKKRYYEL